MSVQLFNSSYTWPIHTMVECVWSESFINEGGGRRVVDWSVTRIVMYWISLCYCIIVDEYWVCDYVTRVEWETAAYHYLTSGDKWTHLNAAIRLDCTPRCSRTNLGIGLLPDQTRRVRGERGREALASLTWPLNLLCKSIPQCLI